MATVVKKPVKKLTEKEKKIRNQKILDSITTEGDIIAAIKKYTPTNATPDRRREINNFFVSVYLDNLKKQEEHISSQCSKVNEKILERAAEKVSGYGTKIDTELEKRIDNLNCFGDQLRYYNIAKESQKWVNYAIWVSVDANAIGITNIDTETKEFVNGICKELHADLQYKNVGVADLELYDPEISGWNNQRFLINLSKIRQLSTLNFQGKINLKNNGFNPLTGQPVNLRSPIKFTFASPNANNTLIDPTIVPDDNTKALLETYVAPYLNGREHWFEKMGDSRMYKLFVRNSINQIPEQFNLIVGYHCKDVVSLICTNVLGMRIVIHPGYHDLWNTVLNNCFYQLTEEETNTSAMYGSQFFWLYELLDLSSVPETDFRNGLDYKLNVIFSGLKAHGVDLFGKTYKFETYESPNKFNLVCNDGSVIFVQNNEAVYRLSNTFLTIQC